MQRGYNGTKIFEGEKKQVRAISLDIKRASNNVNWPSVLFQLIRSDWTENQSTSREVFFETEITEGGLNFKTI